MKIKWERNSRALNLAAQGKIKDEDIIPHATTDDFPVETATVRMQGMSKKVPFITVHIKGKSKQSQNQHHSWTYATTMRVNMGSDWYEEQHGVSGELDKDLSFMDVHNVVTEVRAAMDI